MKKLAWFLAIAFVIGPFIGWIIGNIAAVSL